MDFCSLQHTRGRRSTCRGVSNPATFRLQGLATLLTVCSLRARVGPVSYRRRSWDSPFGVFTPRKVTGRYRPGWTHLPFLPSLWPVRSTGSARRAAVPGLCPSRRFLATGYGVSMPTAGYSPGFSPFQGSPATALIGISPGLLSRASRCAAEASHPRAPQSINRLSPGSFPMPHRSLARGQSDPPRVPAPAHSRSFR
jgi:hypothetical protein